MTGRIFAIKRFAVHDGDGIRTTVFFKGCSLRCVWCHNPEGLGFAPQLSYLAEKCIACGECVSVCPAAAHRIDETGHLYDRTLCTGCGACEAVCFGSALQLYGRTATVEELLSKLLEDRDFYETSGGGVTLSGGECLLQPAFCAALLRALQAEGIHTAVDTCGMVAREAIDQVLPYTDVFLYDLKAIDPAVHQRCTGYTNERILENLRYIDGCGKKIEIRVPYVPGYNADQMEAIGRVLHALQNPVKVRVLAYHNYAGSKYRSLDMENTLPDVPLPAPEEIAQAEETILRWMAR